MMANRAQIALQGWIQCGVDTTQVLTKDTTELGREDELWDVFCKYNIRCILYQFLSYRIKSQVMFQRVIMDLNCV